jgi:ASC-1-like (ASCH) protein
MEQRRPVIHTLKIETEFFKAVKERRKTFEIRKNDRKFFQVGDILILEEYMNGMYLDDECEAEVIYITDYAQREGYVVLGIELH